MRVPKKYFFWLGIGTILLIVFEYYKKEDINWQPTYSAYDEIPYGTAINYALLADGIWKNKIEHTNKTFYQYNSEDSSNATFIYVANRIHFDEESQTALLNHIYKGNTVLISANTISNALLSYFDIEINNTQLSNAEKTYTLNNDVSFIDTISNTIKNELFYYFEWADSISNVKDLGTHIDKTNFIEIKHGKGKLNLHLNPMVFTNYFLLQELSFKYVDNVFSSLPKTKIVWDDFMIYGQKKPQSDLRYVLSSKPMRLAYYLLSILLVLFISLAWRRKQKLIPVIEPVTNNSIEFIDTLTNLYLSNKNNGIIASYLAKNFRIKTNRQYQIQWNKPIGIIKEQLITKSGKSEYEVNQLLNKININEQKTISQSELIALNKTLEAFILK